MLLLVFVSFLSLFGLVQNANILGVFMFPSFSHQIVYQPIWKELSLRGHNVTVVTTDPLNDPTLTNLTEISMRFTYDILKTHRIQNIMSKDISVFQALSNIFELMDIIAESELEDAKFQELINDQESRFDLILIEYFHPVMYGLAGRFKAPIIGISSSGATTAQYEVVGNPNHPILYPDVLLGMPSKLQTLGQKIKSVAFSMWYRFYYRFYILPKADNMARKYFGNISYIGDLEKNLSLLFLSSNPLIHPPRPNVPAIIELGPMHITPIKPLPDELREILDRAKRGVVYFSLGSNVKSVNLAPRLKNVIVKALSQLPYTVLWKWESEDMPGRPSNVVTKRWLPQQDVLAHPNVKVFVTQGGLQSFEETIARGVPLVGMPFLGDQPMNVQKMVELGVGVAVDPAIVDEFGLKEAIVEVAENVKYKNKVRELRDLLFDKPMTGLESAVWWSEYVIRHKGATHLKSATADVTWFSYLMLDVFFVTVLVPVVVIYVCQRVFKMLFASR